MKPAKEQTGANFSPRQLHIIGFSVVNNSNTLCDLLIPQGPSCAKSISLNFKVQAF